MSEHYKLEIPAWAIIFESDRLRWDHEELKGELTVRCDLPGARSINGCLSRGTFNFSSPRTRKEQAKLLRERAQTNGDLDWDGQLEEFCQRVIEAERTGDPDVDLRTLPKPERGDEISINDLLFPRRHPSIIFGDGGTAKSYIALWVAGTLAQQGLSVAFFDWELCGDDHRDRLERMFGLEMPEIRYVLCDRPLVVEADRLRRIVRERNVDYAIFDSVAVACDGPPEAAEVASRYFRAVRQIGCGGLHVAHVSKSSEAADQKPFGSAFWHNLARCTWNVQADPENNSLRLGFFNRKANLGPIRPPVSLLASFTHDST